MHHLIINRELVEAYDTVNNRGYFCDTIEENISKISHDEPVHSWRHIGVDSDSQEALHFYGAHVLYNYVCSVGDTFQVLIDNNEFTLFIKEDGVHYLELTDEEAQDMGDAYWAYDQATSFAGSRVKF